MNKCNSIRSSQLKPDTDFQMCCRVEQAYFSQACLPRPFLAENQVKGLESDEVEFLDFVSDRQTEIEKARELENETVLAEYRASLVTVVIFLEHHNSKQLVWLFDVCSSLLNNGICLRHHRMLL